MPAISCPPGNRLQATGYIITMTIASIGAIYVANRRAKAMEDSAKAGHEAARAGHDANEQKAYNEAVANLGNKESTSARLGGIYGLFDLAQSKPLRRRNITEILCAHLRETTQRKAYQKDNSRQPSNEIQSLLNVLCELHEINLAHREASNIKLNLEQSYLRGANLENKNLREAQLLGANLQGADLGLAKLDRANLKWARLQVAKLMHADLQMAHLNNAGLQGANLARAKLQGAHLDEAECHGANFRRAQLQKAYVWGAKFQAIILNGEELQGTQVILGKAMFTGGLTDEKIIEIQSILDQIVQDGLHDKGIAKALCTDLRKNHMGNVSHEVPKGATNSILTQEMDKNMEKYIKSLGA